MEAKEILPVLILGRDGFGATPTEDEFTRWVDFVCERIDAAAGFEVDVKERRERDVQTDAITRANDEQREAIDRAKQNLWQQWCAAGGVAGVEVAS